MSPEYEGPFGPRGGGGADGDDVESVAPRRVKHLIVLPGGGDPGEGPSEDWGPDGDGFAPEEIDLRPDETPAAPGDAEPVRETDEAQGAGSAPLRRPPRLPWGGSGGAGASGAAAAAAQMADAVPVEVPQPRTRRVNLSVIARSVTSSRAPGMPFIVLASVLITGAILTLVVLRVMVDQASFKVDSLDKQVSSQRSQLRQLQYAVSVQEAPGRVAYLAGQAGLVPATAMQTLVGPGAASGALTSTATPTSTGSGTAPAPSAGQPPRSTATTTSAAIPPARTSTRGASSPSSGGAGPVGTGSTGATVKATTPARATTGSHHR